MSAFDLVKTSQKSATKIANNPSKNSLAVNKNFIPSDVYNDGFYTYSQTNDFKTKLEQLQANVGWVFKANDRVSGACADIELKLEYTNAQGEDQEVKEGEIFDRLYRLLDRPNFDLSGSAFKKLWFTYLNLNGEAYVYAPDWHEGLPLALHILPSHQVQFKIDDNGNRECRFNGNLVDMEYLYREINPDPCDPTKGLSVVRANALTIDMENQSKKFNRNFFVNGARPSVVIESEKRMEDAAFRRFKQQLQEYNQGIANAYNPLVLENGATAKVLALSQKDMDFLASRKFNKDELLAMFGVSPGSLGMTENVNRSNMEAADYGLSKYELRNRIAQLCTFLNVHILQFLPGYKFTFEDPVKEDAAQQLEEDKAYVNVVMTVNEIRERKGLPPLEGGDVIPGLVSSVSSPVNNALEPHIEDAEVIEDDTATEAIEKKLRTQIKKEYKQKLLKSGMIAELAKKKV